MFKDLIGDEAFLAASKEVINELRLLREVISEKSNSVDSWSKELKHNSTTNTEENLTDHINNCSNCGSDDIKLGGYDMSRLGFIECLSCGKSVISHLNPYEALKEWNLLPVATKRNRVEIAEKCPLCNSTRVKLFDNPSANPTVSCQECGFALSSTESLVLAIRKWNEIKRH